jgi:hypothetical protein
MPYYPQLIAGGVTVQRPYQCAQAALTTYEDQPTGRRFARSWRTNPLGRWTLNYQHLTDAELATLQAFFASMGGRYGEFTFLDPGGNLAQYSDDFSAAAWEKYTVTPGAAVTDPFGGTRAVSCLATSGNGMLAAAVLPGGGGAGLVLCASVWVRAAAPASLSIGFIDAGFAVLSAKTADLPANTWVRIQHAHTLASASAVRMLLGGFGTWNLSTLQLFGAQCAPMPGPGAYVRSPANWALRTKCRFDTDLLQVRTLGPNQHAVTVPILETL